MDSEDSLSVNKSGVPATNEATRVANNLQNRADEENEAPRKVDVENYIYAYLGQFGVQHSFGTRPATS